MTRLDLPGLALAASQIRRDVPIFGFSTQKSHTQLGFDGLKFCDVPCDITLVSMPLSRWLQTPATRAKSLQVEIEVELCASATCAYSFRKKGIIAATPRRGDARSWRQCALKNRL